MHGVAILFGQVGCFSGLLFPFCKILGGMGFNDIVQLILIFGVGESFEYGNGDIRLQPFLR
ncbi:hypothetical protein D3C74_480530 [compost metagenome]